jgi:hypothetical protein
MKIDKSRLKGDSGAPLTQGLFLDIAYDYETAVYTLKEEDFTSEDGKLFPSIKRLYLQTVPFPEDGEYDFANKYFLNWKHWQRIVNNRVLYKYIKEWREELEVKLRARQVGTIIRCANDEEKPNFNAAKWLADRGYDKRHPGRPTKLDKEREETIKRAVNSEYEADIHRLFPVDE